MVKILVELKRKFITKTFQYDKGENVMDESFSKEGALPSDAKIRGKVKSQEIELEEPTAKLAKK